MTQQFEDAIVARGRSRGDVARPKLVATPLLTALHQAGTRHVYGDTANVEELDDLLATAEGAIRREVDGNTANQPLVRKVVERYLDEDDPRAWAKEIADHQPNLSRSELLPLLYAILCGRVGNDMAAAFAAGRDWEVSLQLHMGLCGDARRGRRIGQLIRRMVPTAFVKVPFTPDAPDCFLLARDLEQAGIPVNFTSTFSARQAVAAALLADVTRTNIFMGRLNQGLEAKLLGEHVDLEAQRALSGLRREDGTKTQLIIASMREWQTFVRVAGCDVFTAPCGVIRDFLEQKECDADRIESRLETSYQEDLGVSDQVSRKLGPERVARLYRVEPELLEFLHELRGTPEYAKLDDGEELHKRFDRAGFGDLFHFPTGSEREEMSRSKLPQLDGALVERIAIDTHFSLLANADFARYQREIDAEFEKRLDAGGA